MKKIVLDFQVPKTPEQAQRYLALELDLPDYYGENLDALYDMLTEITEDTCIGIFRTRADPVMARYLHKVKRVFRDAESANPHLGVLFDVLEENYAKDGL